MANVLIVLKNGVYSTLVGVNEDDTILWNATTGEWEVSAGGGGGGSGAHDIRGSFVGTPAAGSVIDRYVPARAFTVSATAADHRFYCASLPAAGQTVTLVVKKKAIADGATTTVMTWTISNSGQAAANNGLYAMTISGSVADNTLAAGDLLTVETSGAVDAAFATPIWTIAASE
jgi:hypothetical protein